MPALRQHGDRDFRARRRRAVVLERSRSRAPPSGPTVIERSRRRGWAAGYVRECPFPDMPPSRNRIGTARHGSGRSGFSGRVPRRKPQRAPSAAGPSHPCWRRLSRGQRHRDGGVPQEGDASIGAGSERTSCAAAALALDEDQASAGAQSAPTALLPLWKGSSEVLTAAFHAKGHWPSRIGHRPASRPIAG